MKIIQKSCLAVLLIYVVTGEHRKIKPAAFPKYFLPCVCVCVDIAAISGRRDYLIFFFFFPNRSMLPPPGRCVETKCLAVSKLEEETSQSVLFQYISFTTTLHVCSPHVFK